MAINFPEGTQNYPCKIVQVVATPKYNTFSTSSNSFVDVNDLNVTITPKSSSNKISRIR